MVCRDVACDVQVQHVYVGVTSCRHCQVDSHRVLFGRIICMYVCIWYGRTPVTVTKWTPRGKRDASVKKVESTDCLWY